MASPIEYPENGSVRLFFGNEKGIAFEPSRPAPLASFEPSDKVKEALANILPAIEAVKTTAPDTKQNPEE